MVGPESRSGDRVPEQSLRGPPGQAHSAPRGLRGLRGSPDLQQLSPRIPSPGGAGCSAWLPRGRHGQPRLCQQVVHLDHWILVDGHPSFGVVPGCPGYSGWASKEPSLRPGRELPLKRPH